ncbi:hypothetical protein HD806DRAFT_541221 [Xylariaceae sp. AK1471]|nr:hypothetical protein HD806DRAFT_541221 [Xylariaceae sp. AK1471]
MRFSTIPLLLIATSPVQGSALINDYYWNLTQWQAGLSHGNPATPITSWYAFTVSGPPYGSPDSEPYIPAFGARCTGSASGIPLSSNYSECVVDSAVTESGTSVSARVVPDTDSTRAHIAISYQLSNVYVKESDEERNLTAIAVTDWARERAPYNFTLGPIEVL